MLSAAGIWIIDIGQQQPPRGTPGEPVTVRRIWSWWGDAIRRECRRYGVPVELVVATLAADNASSTNNPLTSAKAVRCEFGYLNDDATPHRVSIGCMQTLLT